MECPVSLVYVLPIFVDEECKRIKLFFFFFFYFKFRLSLEKSLFMYIYLTNQPNLTSTIKKVKFNRNNVFVNIRFDLNIYNIAIIL